MKVSDIAKATGAEWQSLSDHDKKPFVDQAEVLKTKVSRRAFWPFSYDHCTFPSLTATDPDSLKSSPAVRRRCRRLQGQGVKRSTLPRHTGLCSLTTMA